MRAWIGAAMLVASTAMVSNANAKIVADCGAANGKVFYAKANESVWRDDAITGGRVLINALPDDQVNVIFRDAIARTVDVSDEGGVPLVVWRNEDWSKFTVTVLYPETGAVETYILTDSGGKKAYFGPPHVKLWVQYRQKSQPMFQNVNDNVQTLSFSLRPSRGRGGS